MMIYRSRYIDLPHVRNGVHRLKKKKGNNFFMKMFDETDTSLSYFLTLEKVAVSLPTKCLSNPTSGSVLKGNYRLGHAHLPKCEAINRIIFIYESSEPA